MVAWILVALFGALGTAFWRRRRTMWGSLAFAAAAAALPFAFGMRLEREGGGIPRFVTFQSQEAQAERIDAERAKESSTPPVPETTPAPEPAAPAPAREKLAEPEVVHAAVSAAWPDYRGAARDGASTEKILTAWPGGKLPELWRKPVGGGWASFVIAGKLLYTIEQRRQQEVIAAYDVSSGREVWTHKYAADFQESMGGPGPRATPTWHEGKLYSLGATGELFVLDALTGKVLWHKNILEDNGAENITWAMSAAPLLVDDTVIVQPGGSGNRSIVAYNKNSGARVWSALNDRTSYASPMLTTLAGKRQIITITALRAVGLDASSGKLLWEYPWTTEYDINSAQPVVIGPNQVVISSGYGHGAAMLEISANGAKKVWENKKLKNKFNSSVFYKGHIYGFDEAIFTCIDAATGEPAWKAGRYGYGQVLLADGHLVITTEQGEVVLLKADPAGHQELARFQALEGRTWNVPAIADGRLFVRNATEMAAYKIAP
ncbi:MAG TPA: PQQ-binding-like beta-propeller repeat protein [Bryobacteraceae bacterium]|nr:PQQ-binding-like beta-propeller repeat protein [Bryobacteraceae bacterium]